MSVNEIINNYSVNEYLAFLKNKLAGNQEIDNLPLSIYEKIVKVIDTPVSDTLTLNEYDYILAVDDDELGSAPTITLNDASTYIVGRPYTIVKKGSTYNLTIQAASGENINGVSNVVLTSQFESLTIFTDGSNWFKYVTSGGTSDKNYVFTQALPNATWSINHNLDKKVSVMIVDSADSVVYGNISYVDTNNITITFSGAFSGKAYLN